jgi:hypothetical protein
MPSVIQFKRQVASGAVAPVAADVVLAEPAYTDPSAGGNGAGDYLSIGHGGAIAPSVLVGAARQLELHGVQTVATGAPNKKNFDLTNLGIAGGSNGAVLTTDGANTLSWVTAPPATVVTAAPISGDGLVATPVGLTVATTAQIGTGTDNVYPVSSAGLRYLSGDLATLTTTAQNTLVAAINELQANKLATVAASAPITGNGTSGTPLGVQFATTGNAAAGTDTTYPINSLVLQFITGDIATLDTTATNLVDAINEIAGDLTTLTTNALSTVAVTSPITGNGTAGTPLALSMAAAGDITTGTNTVLPVNSAGLRQLMGADVAALTTTAQTVVPAINELRGEIQSLMGPLRLVGTFDASDNSVTATPGGPATTDGLPAAAAGNLGWVFVVDTAGTAAAPAPAVAMSVGDWLVSDGTAWIWLDLNAPTTIAGNVSITTIGTMSAANVQAALSELYTLVNARLTTIYPDGVSITGTGLTAGSPLTVALVDGGVY